MERILSSQFWDRGIFGGGGWRCLHLDLDIQEDLSRENGESSPLKKNSSGLIGVSGRGKIVVSGPQIG